MRVIFNPDKSLSVDIIYLGAKVFLVRRVIPLVFKFSFVEDFERNSLKRLSKRLLRKFFGESDKFSHLLQGHASLPPLEN